MIIVLLLTIVLMLLLALYFCTFKMQDTFINSNKTIVLIGDSMLNNSAYVLDKQSIPDILSNELKGNTVYNFAKDGSTISDCYTQLDKISSELNNSNTFIFLSCGGNNILNTLDKRDLTAITTLFDNYIELIKSIKTRVSNAQIYVLNLYFPASNRYSSYHSAIEKWNKLLKDNASVLGYKLIQTNNLLVLEDDFVYNIEPSFKGGQKIATAIVSSLNEI